MMSHSASFRVVYFDGNSETNLGVVTVEPFRSFNRLLSLLSRKIGISPRNFSVFLAEEGTDRKTPLTRKVDLAAVSSDGAAYYIYVKRSRRYKKSHTKSKRLQPAERATALIRRDIVVEPTPMMDIAELQRKMRNLMMEEEAYLKLSGGEGVGAGAGAVCEECLEATLRGVVAGFHLCVHDEVVVGFRSTAGPISPPAKNSGLEDH